MAVELGGLLALASYIDRVYQEMGKFLSREFQDNIDAFEQNVEPKLGVSRTRAALSMAVLTQLTTAAIAMMVGFTVFRDRAWSIYEILQEAGKLAAAIEGKDVLLRVHPDVAKSLKSNQNKYLEELEDVLRRPVLVKADPLLHQ